MSAENSTSLIGRQEGFSAGLSQKSYTPPWDLGLPNETSANPWKVVAGWARETAAGVGYYVQVRLEDLPLPVQRAICHFLVDQMPDEGLHELIESQVDMLDFYGSGSTSPLPFSPPQPLPRRVGARFEWPLFQARGGKVSAVAMEGSELSPQGVLAKLMDETTSHQVRRRMVIEAEVLPFGPDQIGELNTALRGFIDDCRNSDDPEDLVAVASAIRKYAATVKRDDLGALAMLLASDQNGTVPLEVELEVAKTLVRKLTASPPEESDTEPELADRLMDMAGTYLNPRLLSREKYGAVALNAVLALPLLRTRRMADLLPVLKELRVPWFTQLVVRRASRIRNDLSQRFSQPQAERYLECLNAMCDELVASEA